MAHTVDNIHVKQRSFSHITYFYTHNSVGVKIGIQFFRLNKAISSKNKIEDLINAIEAGEVSTVNDLYGFMNKGYIMSATTKEKFMQYAEERK